MASSNFISPFKTNNNLAMTIGPGGAFFDSDKTNSPMRENDLLNDSMED